MSRNRKYSKSKDDKSAKRNNPRGPKSNRQGSKSDDKREELVVGDRPNNPNWYFTDAMLADQVSQLSFQNLAGLPVHMGGRDWNVPNLVRIEMNPSLELLIVPIMVIRC